MIWSCNRIEVSFEVGESLIVKLRVPLMIVSFTADTVIYFETSQSEGVQTNDVGETVA